MATTKKGVYAPGQFIKVKRVKTGDVIEVDFEHYAVALRKQGKYVAVDGESLELKNAIRDLAAEHKERFND